MLEKAQTLVGLIEYNPVSPAAGVSNSLAIPSGLSNQAEKLALSESKADNKRQLDTFLASVETRAFTMAQISTRNHDEALDIVQEAMISLVTRYASKPESQWRPLFYRILHNKINDWHRKRRVRAKFHFWSRDDSGDDDTAQSENDAAYNAVDTKTSTDGTVQDDQTMQQIASAVNQLPLRQQQAFMLRLWEGLDVRETATAMSCSEGSVKTHLSRALASLRKLLEPPA